jgi:hypothetical protein
MYTITLGSGQPVYLKNDHTEKELKQANLRVERNYILSTTDCFVTEDFPTTKKAEWKTYRKALRDMDFSDPDNITWPSKPE